MAKTARVKKSKGISPAGKVAILCVTFGIPALFFASSWGLSKLFEIAPATLVVVLVIASTIYTAYTAQLMYDFYEVNAPILRFIPCVCEVSLLDMKYHLPCYILYGLAILFGAASQLPYSVLKILGEGFALSASFYLVVIAIILLAIIQVIKGIGIMQTMKDIGVEWKKQVHADVGVLDKLTPLGFIPFVRVIALYSLNKPLSTLVSFMGATVDDTDEESSFEEE